MELSFKDGVFVANKGHLNYQKVLDSFANAEKIRIVTYNISKNESDDPLLNAIANSGADVQIITNVPGRFEQYYNTPAGETMRKKARDNISVYIRKLDPENFNCSFRSFFNINNHAKIIGTENIVYIGSANFSNESITNIETGVLIQDKDFIEKLYTDFFDMIKEKSLSYDNEYFSPFRLLVISLHSKFQIHYNKLLKNLFFECHGKNVLISDDIQLSIEDLQMILLDLEEFNSLSIVADNTYDDRESEYNHELIQLQEQFSHISIDWIESIISEDGSLYSLVSFDQNQYMIDRLQNDYYAEAYDEYLETYVQKSVNDAFSEYETLHEEFENDAQEFISEFKKIIDVLKQAVEFAAKWKPKKVAQGLDNTK